MLVLGGSQGARSLNDFVRARRRAGRRRPLALAPVRPGRRDEAPAPGPHLRVEEYVAPVAPALAAATLVLCRGGASTLAEVAAARVPALVVPYPHHADRHQERNARELGAGVRLVDDAALDAAFARELARLAGPAGRAERDAMRAALAAASSADAALILLRELATLAGR
ncbi:MAG: hypothetical protein H6828_03715 [Planctomycetes bacterium]|nr:hypothetical protein [Planctomycetota bacterium]